MKAYRIWNKATGSIYYVAQLKGKVGDWGYTSDPSQAIRLTPYWQRRFAADCKYVGYEARFI